MTKYIIKSIICSYHNFIKSIKRVSNSFIRYSLLIKFEERRLLFLEIRYDKHELLGKQVYLDVGEALGETNCAIFDKATHKVIALGIQKNNNAQFLNIVPYKRIVYIDDEAIIIPSKTDIISYDEFFAENLKKAMADSYKTNYKI